MIVIRAARTYDAGALAELCGQLGYPATRAQVISRLAVIEASRSAVVLVAEDAGSGVIGWVHVAVTPHLTDQAVAEIVGLVVAESARAGGVGVQLVDAAEDWARQRGNVEMRVRSRVERARAHRFYERAGYERVKTQVMFRKALATTDA